MIDNLSNVVTVDLNGKIALVTGGGRGIGRTVAVALAKNGAKVIVTSRSIADLEETKRIISAMGGSCCTLPSDVSKVDEIYSLVEKAYETWGQLDILVNSAGINIPKPSLEVTEDDWDKVIDTNLKGTFFCCQAVGKKMVQQKYGKIINITSQMAFVGYYKRAPYAASKGGVTQLSKVLAIELAPDNINVNCIAPTFLETPFTEKMFQDKEFLNDVLTRIPLNRLGSAEDVVGAVLYLVSSSADMVTGSTVMVDGGWVAW